MGLVAFHLLKAAPRHRSPAPPSGRRPHGPYLVGYRSLAWVRFGLLAGASPQGGSSAADGGSGALAPGVDRRAVARSSGGAGRARNCAAPARSGEQLIVRRPTS